MSIFKKPSQLTPKFAMSALIYGQPGIGKTTLACSAPGAVLLDYDGGATRIAGAHQVPTLQVTSWEQTEQALAEIRQTPEMSSIVVDTVGKMLSSMDEAIRRLGPKMTRNDGALSLQGYGVRKRMFIDFIRQATASGRHLIFVAHEIEQRRGDETILRPEVGGSSANDLIKELDLVGYMEMIGNDRTISFAPSERYYAKKTNAMPAGKIKIPVTVDRNNNPLPNTYMAQIIGMYQKNQADNLETNSRYEDLCDLIRQNVADIDSADAANEFTQWLKSITHIYNSLTVAREAFAARVNQLGLVLDPDTKTYRDA